MNLKIILASSSPRRKDLLTKIGIKVTVIPPDIIEKTYKGEKPEDYTIRISREKALSVSKKLKNEYVIVGADTVVFADGEILGKPLDGQAAKNMLIKISGRTHKVVTGYTIVRNSFIHSNFVESGVKIKDLEPFEIEGYIKTGEPMDKAGAYAIQGIGAFMVEEIQGSYTNIVGLPLPQLLDNLVNFGLIKLFN